MNKKTVVENILEIANAQVEAEVAAPITLEEKVAAVSLSSLAIGLRRNKESGKIELVTVGYDVEDRKAQILDVKVCDGKFDAINNFKLAAIEHFLGGEKL